MRKLRLIGWLGAGAIAILLQRGPIQAALALLPGDQAIPLVVGPVPALFQSQPTPINGYPGSAETPLPTAGAYPGLQPSPPTETDTPYPVATATPESGFPPLPVIGQEVDPAAPEPAAPVLPASTSQAARGRLFLWGGFVIALLLFATGVAAAIVLFTRRHG